jgi:high-affinity nickel permease
MYLLLLVFASKIGLIPLRLQALCCEMVRLVRKKLTLAGRSYFIAGCLLLANLGVWIAAISLFAPSPQKRRVLSLCLVAWTLGLRHALDADHIRFVLPVFYI